MSVEIEGPRGYEFQYLITSAIAIQNLSCQSLIVESEAGEDAKLSISLNGIIHTVDVQVKSATGDVSIELLCEWLNHFTARQSNENLLSKLLNDPNRIAVFVCGGRCRDVLREFIANFGDFLNHPQIPRDLPNTFIDSLRILIEGMSVTTRLKRERKNFSETQVTTLSNELDRIMDALMRVFVWESTTTDEAESLLSASLSKNLYVPLFCCKDAIHEFNAAVRSSRDTRSDVMPEINRIISRRSGRALLGTDSHLDTGIELTLLSELRQNRVLLLTGRSMCGKTNMARYLGQMLQQQGVNATLGQDVDEAYRFLTVRHEEPRLYVLEDPFDRIENAAESIRVNEVLRRLVNELSQHRFLIVTSKLAVVPSEVSAFQSSTWHDLSINDPDFLANFWRSRCAKNELLVSLEPKLTAGLKAQLTEELLQPGHLFHLSRLSELKDAEFEVLCRLARFDITQLAQNLAESSRASRRVHTALCMGASTTQYMSVEELKYVLYGESQRPTFSSSIGIIYSAGGGYDEFPSLPVLPDIHEEDEYEIVRLERSGHLRTTSQGFEFTHPDYLSASRVIVGSYSLLNLPKLLEILERGLASISESTALLSCQILKSVYAKYGIDDSNRSTIFAVSSNAYKSIYPAVRDAVLHVVIGWIDSLNSDCRKTALRMVRDVDYGYNEILWHGDVPWTSSSRDMFGSLFHPEQPQSDETDDLLKLMVEPHANIAITPRTAWHLLHYLEANTSASSPQVLAEFMKQPYAFIRAKAAQLLIEQYMDDWEYCLKLLRSEENPGVIFRAIRTCFSVWQSLQEKTKHELIPWLISQVSATQVAVVCSDLFTDFGDSHSNYGPDWEALPQPQKQSVWSLWATLFPIYLNAIAPHPFEHNASRMYNTLQVAMDQLGRPEFSPILDAWVVWVEGQIQIRILDEFELPIAELLLSVEEPSERRTRYIERLIQHCDTGLSVITIDIIIEHWQSLSDDEKKLLIDELRADKRDSRWRRAVSITRKNVPKEVQLVLTGIEDLLEQSTPSVMETLEPGFLSDALHVYCGNPQPLWWYGTHHKTAIPWKSILEIVVEDPKHRDFKLAISEMFYFAESSGKSGWHDTLSIWRRLCSKSDRGDREQLFNLLLLQSVTVTGPDVKGFWPALYEAARGENESTNYTDRIIQQLRSITLNVDNLNEFLGKDFVEQILSKLSTEQTYLNLRTIVLGNSSEETKRRHLADFSQIIQEHPPRIYYIFKPLDNLLAKLTFTEAITLRKVVEDARLRFIDLASNEAELLEDTRQIEDWVTCCRL